MSTRVEGSTALILVTAQATLRAGHTRLTLSAREGPAPGTWRYNLSDGTDNRIQNGRITAQSNHLEVLRHAASECTDAYEPGTTERGLLEQFADPSQDQP